MRKWLLLYVLLGGAVGCDNTPSTVTREQVIYEEWGTLPMPQPCDHVLNVSYTRFSVTVACNNTYDGRNRVDVYSFDLDKDSNSTKKWGIRHLTW